MKDKQRTSSVTLYGKMFLNRMKKLDEAGKRREHFALGNRETERGHKFAFDFVLPLMALYVVYENRFRPTDFPLLIVFTASCRDSFSHTWISSTSTLDPPFPKTCPRTVSRFARFLFRCFVFSLADISRPLPCLIFAPKGLSRFF